MLLAAGRGERLRPLTDTIPKALVEVGGEPLIERHLRMLSSAGVSTVVINLGWHGEQVVERLGGGSRFGLTIAYSPEYDDILETGGGILRALPLLGDEPFWVINADILTDWRLPAVDPLSLPGNDALGHLVTVPNPPYRERGDFDLDDGRLHRDAALPLTFAGLARYRPEFFAECRPGRFGMAPLMFAAAARGALSGERYDGLWADVGTPERLAQAEAMLTGGGGS